MYLTLEDVQKIVNAMIEESDKDASFKSLTLSDTEEAIKYIIFRDFPKDVQIRYMNTLEKVMTEPIV